VKDEEIKIKISSEKTVTLKDLFNGKEETRQKMAELSFEKKVHMLISLQETAHGWGGKKDVLVWRS
jgi:hypothetical protein